MKKYFYLIIFLVLIAGALISLYFIYRPHKTKIKINNQIFNIEVVKSTYDIEKGLSGREKIADNQGMLFEFKDYDIRNFWMKDMKFPLDILFIDNEIIKEITTLLKPENGTTPSYTSQNKVNYVLELNAGAINKYKISVGNTIEFIK